MKKLLLATTAVLGLAAAPGIAHATLTWDILTGVNVGSTISTSPALQANPAGFLAALALAGASPSFMRTPGISDVDTLNLNSGAGNLINTFLLPTGLSVAGNPVMSNTTNTITTAIHISETFTDQAGFGFPSPGSPLMSGLTHERWSDDLYRWQHYRSLRRGGTEQCNESALHAPDGFASRLSHARPLL